MIVITGRINTLSQELLEAKRQIDELRRMKLELENELAQNRNSDSEVNRNQQQLQEKIERFDWTGRWRMMWE